MKDNFNLKILIIVIIAIVVILITIAGLLAHFAICDECRERFYNLPIWEINKADNDSTNTMIPVVNNNNSEAAGDLRCLTVTNVIQRVLENTLKENDDIALMAVYSEDGTILAHLKPDRIGKNMSDAEVELSYCMREMHKAMKNSRIYSGLKFDPLLNDYIRFILKPLQIGNFDQKLSLLIGVHRPK